MRRLVKAMLLGVAMLGIVVGRADETETMKRSKAELRQAEEHANKAFEEALEGHFKEALRLERMALAIRQRWLPDSHELVQGGKRDVERWKAIADLSAEKQKQLGSALEKQNTGYGFHNKERYEEAEKAHREALAIYRKVLGKSHSETTQCHDNVLGSLQSLVEQKGGEGKFEVAEKVARRLQAFHEEWQGKTHWETRDANLEVERWQRLTKVGLKDRDEIVRSHKLHTEGWQLFEKGEFRQALAKVNEALEICKMVLGVDHPDTASNYNNVARCLDSQGKHARALPLHEKALEIFKKVHGEEHPHTATSYDSVAMCLNGQGQHARALPLHEKALEIRKKVLGEQHPRTVESYNNLAYCLNKQGKHARALPLHEKALEIWKKVLGEQHPSTATSYNNVARCLDSQGKHARALPLHEKALEIFKKVHGEEHPHTAASYNNVAFCLNSQGLHARALPLHEKALEIFKKVHGEEHPHTATSYDNVASCLSGQGLHARALPLYEKALEIRTKVLGVEHPGTATSYNNVASCLNEQGKHPKALPLLEKALEIFKKVHGEEHPHTDASYSNLALCLWQLERVADANRLLQQSLPWQETARFHKASSGFDRAIASQEGISPHALLALGLAREKQDTEAFVMADSGLGRAVLDDLLVEDADSTRMTSLRSRLATLDSRLVQLFGVGKQSKEQEQLREDLLRQRRTLSTELARLTAAVSARQVLSPDDIQEQIPDDAALVFWLDIPLLKEYQACIVRRKGTPTWVRLKGSGKDGEWIKKDGDLPINLFLHLASPNVGTKLERQQAIADLHRLRMAPLEAHLGANNGLPAVCHLLVVPTDWTAIIPVEAITSKYRVSYVASGSVYARMRQQQRSLSGGMLLALGDPAFSSKPRPSGEPSGVSRSPDPAPLPGARREVAALAGLVTRATALLGSAASEQRLDEMLAANEMKTFRLIHLATHGNVNLEQPDHSAVLLARDSLPDPRQQTQQGQKVYTGYLTVQTIRRQWRGKLDADMVVLSACVTGLGRSGGGDGMLGFAQAFVSAGARTVVLSRWCVSDDSTALLMRRFYQNVLGKREGLKAPMKRAEALEEARNWLQNLSRKEAGDAVASLSRGSVGPLPGTGVASKEPDKVESPRPLPPGEKPYAHPYFWAPFVLIGDPD